MIVASIILLPTRAQAQAEPNPLAELARVVASAEGNLREGERQQAESLYRSALFDAWMMLGQLHMAAAKMAEARDAFERASRAIVDADAALQALAVVDLQTGRAADAVDVLTRVAGRHEKDVALQRLLAQALMANGQLQEACAGVRDGACDRPEGSRARVPARLRLPAGRESSTRPSGCSPR